MDERSLARTGRSKMCTPKQERLAKKKQKQGFEIWSVFDWSSRRAKRRKLCNLRFGHPTPSIHKVLQERALIRKRPDIFLKENDGVDYRRSIYQHSYEDKFPDPKSKYTRGVYTVDREKERRIHEIEFMKYECTGTPMSEWGNVYIKVWTISSILIIKGIEILF